MGKHRLQHRHSGFSLLEVVVIVIVLGLLAGLVAPSAKNLIGDSKAQQIATLADALRDACTRYEMDTNTYAMEGVFDAPNADGEYTSAITEQRKYNLSFSGGIAGWQGPYLDHPLLPSDNPFGQSIRVADKLVDLPTMTGFDLDGSGVTRTGGGNMLIVQLDPRNRAAATDMATRIDQIIDKSNGAANWKTQGRVNFVLASSVLYIYLYKAP